MKNSDIDGGRKICIYIVCWLLFITVNFMLVIRLQQRDNKKSTNIHDDSNPISFNEVKRLTKKLDNPKIETFHYDNLEKHLDKGRHLKLGIENVYYGDAYQRQQFITHTCILYAHFKSTEENNKIELYKDFIRKMKSQMM